VWWEGLTKTPPSGLTDWRARDWTADTGPAAHPNARFTTPAAQCPSAAAEWEDPAGVPIDAFLFGGRRSTVMPLVFEAYDWEQGVFQAAQMSSETTAAATGAVGELRFDPMAMLPFCGYHMGDYFAHWLRIGQREGARPPKIFFVNWFRKGPDGGFLWPGFGENSRVLAWIFERCGGNAQARETALGFVPVQGENGIPITGLDTSETELADLLDIDVAALAGTLSQVRAHFASFGDKLPAEFGRLMTSLEQRLGAV
jgi:phosphoenolpyruvate carboxykinase (GTP)